MLDGMTTAPADPILGLTEAFKADKTPDKINLGVGVYKDETGVTPVLASVKAAEKKILVDEGTKSYLGIDGLAEMGTVVQGLLFGPDHEILAARRAATAQTPGGTGALRVAGDLIKRTNPDATVWLSSPTWANHGNVFGAAGVATASYPYYDKASRQLDFDAMTDALAKVPAGDVVVLHACCHNPSGMDPTPEQWRALAEVAVTAGWTPLFDFAYQGFGDGLDEDAGGVRTFAEAGRSMLVASSFSKNFGLYNERVGALTVVARSADDAGAVMSHIKKCIRANYSNPPAHGGKIVVAVLDDPTLRATWEEEVAAMRNRINGMRDLFVKTLADEGVQEDFSFITTQKGMFSFSGLTVEQVHTLREKHAIYIVDSGRINVAGMTPDNMPRLCKAIKDVLGEA
ncbi:MAG: amino acid aminotransferase [Planctomycetota bacterium]